MAIFKGAGVAIVTPMKNNEEVNYDKLEELINQQIDGGTDAIVIAGTTGEKAQHLRWNIFVDRDQGSDLSLQSIVFRLWQVPVQTKHVQPSSSFHRRQKRQEQTDFYPIVTPYYNKATQAGLISPLFTDIADSTKCPIIMHTVPVCTGCNLLPETVAELGHDEVILRI